MALDQTPPLNSLGFAKAPADTRVVVAMSGGVDSSVVAAMLADEGYDVVGVTLQLYDHGAALAKKGACCAGVDIQDARRVAEEMGFPHYVLDYENVFKDAVIDEFADSYLGGATPVPCIRCNERVKFKDLLETAKDLKADCMPRATISGAKWAPMGRNCMPLPMATAIKAISYSPPPKNNSTTCASRWAICRARMTPARWRRNTGWLWLTNPTAKTSVSSPMATMLR